MTSGKKTPKEIKSVIKRIRHLTSREATLVVCTDRQWLPETTDLPFDYLIETIETLLAVQLGHGLSPVVSLCSNVPGDRLQLIGCAWIENGELHIACYHCKLELAMILARPFDRNDLAITMLVLSDNFSIMLGRWKKEHKKIVASLFKPKSGE